MNYRFSVVLQEAADEYLKNHYKSGAIAVFSTSGEGLYNGVICVQSEVSNRKSFWSGRWRGTFRVHLASETKAILEGEIVDVVHYYEDGNVLMQARHPVKQEVESKDLPTLAKKVLAAVSAAEGKFHQDIESQCSQLSEDTFKAMRRRLPITKEPFNFASSAHKLAAELQKQAKA
eukprot:TRINITY_DN1460_c0_g1_i2.p1 TRINITY_DN1460_c0_g1~~TRINITY_DN1460_c0_g1_i2.p1  ORF type:complete len:175 (-),score=41.42 TRINITY_DN1460_c0_g1_i2:21-545(-)